MKKFLIIALSAAAVWILAGCTQPEPSTSTPENYMSEGSAMEPDPEIVKQKEAAAGGSRSVDSRGGGAPVPEKGGR